MTRINKFAYAVTVVFITVLFIISSLWCGGAGVSYAAAAATDVQSAFESRNVLDDLSGSTIGGEKFSLDTFGWDDGKKTQVISFVEYCYGYYASETDDYALYVYVYNPQCENYVYDSVLNEITIACASDKDDKTVTYYSYNLIYLNMSTKTGYEGLFFKYKVKLSAAEKERILNSVDTLSRVYKIGEIELLISGETNAQSYAVGSSYTYSGYAEGYGNNYATSDTLSCTVDNFSEVLSFDVRSTYYRPEGSNGSSNKQDTLHSVYFSVPNSVIDEYGAMSAVHATWLNALTSPILVTGNNAAYEALLNIIGKELPSVSSTYSSYYCDLSVQYAYVSDFACGWFASSYGNQYEGTTAFNYYNSSGRNAFTRQLQKLAYLFYSGEDDNSADSYILSSDELMSWMKSYSSVVGGSLVNGKYSVDLFDEVDETFTDVTISDNVTYDLTSQVLGSYFWEEWIGASHVVSSTTYDNIPAIYPVSDKDFNNLSETQVCDNLYISTSDYQDFVDYYNEATANDETVYLFRYYKSEYSSEEASLVMQNANKSTDTNAYFAQMWVQLDFDIIDVTFTKNDVSTVIPVSMSPMDIVADGTPPITITSDGGIEWWKVVLAVLAVILLFVLFYPILMPVLKVIVKALWWLICLPFKLIAKLVKAIKNAANKDKDKKE